MVVQLIRLPQCESAVLDSGGGCRVGVTSFEPDRGDVVGRAMAALRVSGLDCGY